MSKSEWQDSKKMKEGSLVKQLTSLKSSLDEVIENIKIQREQLVKEYNIQEEQRGQSKVGE